jgi:putative endonuclease
MDDNCYLVFVEVRYRRKQDYGDGLESITPAKLRKIIKTSQFFSIKNNFLQKNMRIDIVSISGSIITPKITWIKNIHS